MYKYSAGYLSLLRKLLRLEPEVAMDLIRRDLARVRLGTKETASKAKNINVTKPISQAAKLGARVGSLGYGASRYTGRAIGKGYEASGKAANKVYDFVSGSIPDNRKKQIAGYAALGGTAASGLGGYGVYKANKRRQPGLNVNRRQVRENNSLNNLLNSAYGS